MERMAATTSKSQRRTTTRRLRRLLRGATSGRLWRPRPSAGARSPRASAPAPACSLVAIAIFVLSRTLAHLNMAELRAALAATSTRQIALGLLLHRPVLSDPDRLRRLALHQLKLKVPYRTTALGSFASYAVSFTLGFPIFTGGTVRYWIYSRAGVRPGKIASLTVVAGVTFWLGMAVVIGFGLLVDAEPLSEIDHLAVNLNRLIGLGVLVADRLLSLLGLGAPAPRALAGPASRIAGPWPDARPDGPRA